MKFPFLIPLFAIFLSSISNADSRLVTMTVTSLKDVDTRNQTATLVSPEGQDVGKMDCRRGSPITDLRSGLTYSIYTEYDDGYFQCTVWLEDIRQKVKDEGGAVVCLSTAGQLIDVGTYHPGRPIDVMSIGGFFRCVND